MNKEDSLKKDWCMFLLKPNSFFGDLGIIDDYAVQYALHREKGIRKLFAYFGMSKGYEREFLRRFFFICETNNAEILSYRDIDFIKTNKPNELAEKILKIFPYISLQAVNRENEIRLYQGSNSYRKSMSYYILPHNIIFTETSSDNS